MKDWTNITYLLLTNERGTEFELAYDLILFFWHNPLVLLKVLTPLSLLLLQGRVFVWLFGYDCTKSILLSIIFTIWVRFFLLSLH
jgi:hypothetical protein